MQNILTNAFNEPHNKSLTDNGAVQRATTNSAVLDLFSQIGAYRTGGKGAQAFVNQLMRSFGESRELTLKTLFHARDCRGGLGERTTFKEALKHLAEFAPKSIAPLVQYIPTFGRWDDLYCLLGTPVEENVWAVIRSQWDLDADAEKPSIMAKWLASCVTSSAQTRAYGRATAKALGLTERQYRQQLSALRKKIGVVEQLISAGKWEDVNYSHVPSQANLLYGKAFMRHDEARRGAFFEALEKGETTIKASTQFPYEIIRKVETDTQLAEAMWKAQTDYFNGQEENSLVVADVSGSMHGLPLDVCLSLAIYTAERNKGVWHNKFITFSEHPTMQELRGETLLERVRNLNMAQWDMNTSVQKVFEVILQTACSSKVTPTDMVKRLFIVSDMQFDACTGKNKKDKTLFNWLQKKYKDEGYEIPELIFWNVSAQNPGQPMSLDDRGFLNVSGCSPSIFKSVLGKKFISAYDLMIDVLNQERYAVIK